MRVEPWNTADSYLRIGTNVRQILTPSTNTIRLKDTSKPQRRPGTAERGLILLDRSLKIIASDSVANAILMEQNQPQALPKEILDSIRQCKPAALSSLRVYLRIGMSEYMCRAYLLEWFNWLASQPMIAVHLSKVSTSNDAVRDAGVKYDLTNREQEVLRGISLGLPRQTIADRMEISPNTVKVFLRQIMIKMGVRSCAGIAATMLKNRETADKRSGPPGNPPGSEFKEVAMAKAAAAGAGPLARLNEPDSRKR